MTEIANEPTEANGLSTTSSFPSQTQATVLASQSELSFIDDQQDGVSQTQATVLASTQQEPSLSIGEEVLETQPDDDMNDADLLSQTQATVLASQPVDDASFELGNEQESSAIVETLDQMSTEDTLVMPSQTQATVLASQVETQPSSQ
jgi:hypothetical protein